MGIGERGERLLIRVGSGDPPAGKNRLLCHVEEIGLLNMQCVVVAIAMKQEFGTWKWFGIAFAYQMVLAWIVAFTIYHGGRLMGLS